MRTPPPQFGAVVEPMSTLQKQQMAKEYGGRTEPFVSSMAPTVSPVVSERKYQSTPGMQPSRLETQNSSLLQQAEMEWENTIEADPADHVNINSSWLEPDMGDDDADTAPIPTSSVLRKELEISDQLNQAYGELNMVRYTIKDMKAEKCAEELEIKRLKELNNQFIEDNVEKLKEYLSDRFSLDYQTINHNTILRCEQRMSSARAKAQIQEELNRNSRKLYRQLAMDIKQISAKRYETTRNYREWKEKLHSELDGLTDATRRHKAHATQAYDELQEKRAELDYTLDEILRAREYNREYFERADRTNWELDNDRDLVRKSKQNVKHWDQLLENQKRKIEDVTQEVKCVKCKAEEEIQKVKDDTRRRIAEITASARK